MDMWTKDNVNAVAGLRKSEDGMERKENGSAGNLFVSDRVPSRVILPVEGEVRARRVVKRSNFGHTYKFPSVKCNRIIELEYGLERDRAILLEVDPFVVLYQEQPFCLVYYDNGNVRIYPDFLVTRVGGTLTVEEVKPWDMTKSPEFQRRLAIEEVLLCRYGYDFELQTEKEIRAEPRLANCKRLLPYRRMKVNEILLAEVNEALAGTSLDGHDLIGQVAGLTEEAVLVMAAHGRLVADLSIPLSKATGFSLLQGDRHDAL